MQTLICHLQVPKSATLPRLSVLVYSEPGADFPFSVYSGADKVFAVRRDAFVCAADALKLAQHLVNVHLDQYL